MKIIEVLIEGKIELIAQKQGQKILKAFKLDRTVRNHRYFRALMNYKGDDIEEKTVSTLLEYLQLIHKKYLQWLVNHYTKREFQVEDARRLRDTLKQFDKIKGKLQKKDINQYKTLSELEETVETHTVLKGTASNKQKDREFKKMLFDEDEAEIHYKDSELTVIIPHTERASCYFGKGTRWCTAATGYNMFDRYTAGDEELFIIFAGKRKYQFHFESKSFMDEQDSPVNLAELLDEYPQLLKVFGSDLADNMPTRWKLEHADDMDESEEDIIRHFKEEYFPGDVDGDGDITIAYHHSLDSVCDAYGQGSNISAIVQLLSNDDPLEEMMDNWYVFDEASDTAILQKYLSSDTQKYIESGILKKRPALFDLPEGFVLSELENYDKGLFDDLVKFIKEEIPTRIIEAMTKYIEELVDENRLEDENYGGYVYIRHVAGSVLEGKYEVVIDDYQVNEMIAGEYYEYESDEDIAEYIRSLDEDVRLIEGKTIDEFIDGVDISDLEDDLKEFLKGRL